MQVGAYSSEISKVLLALDPTLRALRSAVRKGAQLLLTHHPLIFKPISRLEANSYPGDVIIEAVKNGVSVVAAHTNLDVTQGGMNDILARLLGLEQVEVLGEVDQAMGAGLGRIGYLAQPTELSTLVVDVKAILGSGDLKVVGPGLDMVHRIALVAGSGGGMVSLAAGKGADLLLTGDVSHHHALEAESLGIALIDGGHFCTENKAFKAFADSLRDMVEGHGWEVAVEVDEDETDPMRLK